jgi:hypothetical protein
VTLEHRGFESYGEPGDNTRKEVGGEEGWPVIIERYAEVARR